MSSWLTTDTVIVVAGGLAALLSILLFALGCVFLLRHEQARSQQSGYGGNYLGYALVSLLAMLVCGGFALIVWGVLQE